MAFEKGVLLFEKGVLPFEKREFLSFGYRNVNRKTRLE